MKQLKITFLLLSVLISATDAYCQSTIREGIRVGDKAPEIVEKSVTGQPIKLSSLAGKIVLIDFWASWCRPCRNENPYVVAAYEKYKDANFKGGKKFTIFSVSLDRDFNAWKNAIQADRLTWENHICKPNDEAVYLRTYEIRFIPTNFLIDGNGVIIATNLRGEALDKKLAELKN